MLFLQSCVVADPPEYRAPGQTRPVLNVYSAVPTATQVLVIYNTNLIKPITNFTVQIRSEDAGEDLRALFFLDYQMPGQSKLVSMPIAASTYDYEGRYFTYPWPTKDVSGCHFLSLIVAHRSSFSSVNEDELNQRDADEDAAIVTWTVNVNPPPDLALENCPSRMLPTVQ